MGDKSTTLEMICLLLPWLSIPKKLKNQHVVFAVDNIACVHGWENRSLKGEIMASIIIFRCRNRLFLGQCGLVLGQCGLQIIQLSTVEEQRINSAVCSTRARGGTNWYVFLFLRNKIF